MELPIDRNHNGDNDNTSHHPPSVSQALDLLNNRLAATGKPIKIAIELKGSLLDPEHGQLSADKLTSRGMQDQVNVHAFSFTRAQYIENAGIPDRGYAVPTAGPLPSARHASQYGGNIFIEYRLATPQAVAKYSGAPYNLKVWIFTMDTRREYDAALDLGEVYAWQVDDLLEAQDYLAEAE